MGKTRFRKSRVYGNGLGVIDNSGVERNVVSNTGALELAGSVPTAALADGAVTAPKLAEGSFWTHMMAYTIGLGANWAGSETTGDKELMANPSVDQEVMVIVTVIEEFADDATNDQAVMKIGTAAGGDQIMEDDVLDDAPEGFQYIWTGEIDAAAEIVNLHVTQEQDPACTGEVNILVLSRDA